MTASPPQTGLLPTIGNTPLIKLERLSNEHGFNIFGKMEALNPGGSIKDRTATTILQDAIDKGHITKNTTVIESSSGNMAIGLAQFCKYYKLKLIVVVDPNINKRNLDILETYGAKVSFVEKPHPTEGYLGARLERVRELLDSTPNSFWTNQYGNGVNVKTHMQTMREIAEQLDNNLDYLFAAASTCGTLMGCAEYANQNGLKTKIVAVDAVGSVLFGGEAKKRLLPGHGAGRKSQFLKEDLVYKALQISDIESVKGCRKLLDEEAVLAGGSSGAVISAIGKMKDEIPAGANVAAIICDRGERYLETVYNDQWVFEHLNVDLSGKFERRLRLVA